MKLEQRLRCSNYIWVINNFVATKSTIIGSDSGSSLGRRQAIVWANAAILKIAPLGNSNRYS